MSLTPTNTPPNLRLVAETPTSDYTFLDAIEWLISYAPDEFSHALACKLQTRARTLERLGLYDFKFVVFGKIHPVSSKHSVSNDGSCYFDTDLRKITVYIRGQEFGSLAGTTYETIMHECVHALFEPVLRLGKTSRWGTNSFTRAHRETEKLHKIVSAQLALAGKSLDSSCDLYRRMCDLNQHSNLLANEGEFLAWSLSNLTARRYLENLTFTSCSRDPRTLSLNPCEPPLTHDDETHSTGLDQLNGVVHLVLESDVDLETRLLAKHRRHVLL